MTVPSHKPTSSLKSIEDYAGMSRRQFVEALVDEAYQNLGSLREVRRLSGFERKLLQPGALIALPGRERGLRENVMVVSGPHWCNPESKHLVARYVARFMHIYEEKNVLTSTTGQKILWRNANKVNPESFQIYFAGILMSSASSFCIRTSPNLSHVRRSEFFSWTGNPNKNLTTQSIASEEIGGKHQGSNQEILREVQDAVNEVVRHLHRVYFVKLLLDEQVYHFFFNVGQLLGEAESKVRARVRK